MKAKLVAYELSKLDQYHKVLVNRALFGYTDNSNKGDYQYERKGVVSDIPHFRLLRGAIIVKNKDLKRINSVLKKHKVKHIIFDISVKESMLH